jgi:hypothetical protein
MGKMKLVYFLLVEYSECKWWSSIGQPNVVLKSTVHSSIWFDQDQAFVKASQ